MEYKEFVSFIEIYWSLVSLADSMTFTIFDTLLDLVIVLKWIKNVIGCVLYIFHLYGWTYINLGS